jgi:hypothetical protein
VRIQWLYVELHKSQISSWCLCDVIAVTVFEIVISIIAIVILLMLARSGSFILLAQDIGPYKLFLPQGLVVIVVPNEQICLDQNHCGCETQSTKRCDTVVAHVEYS